MSFSIIDAEIKFKITAQVATLFEQKPELFERIDLRDYASKPGLEDLNEELLSQDGKAGWITIDDERVNEMLTYRFYWDDICREILGLNKQ